MLLLRQVAAAALVCLALVLALRPPPTGPAGPAVATTPVVVATADLPAGTVLTAGDLAAAGLPTGLVPAGTEGDPAALTGQQLAAPVRAGEPVSDVRLVGPGLWSAVPDGQVAAPVRLADLAVATLLRAGDRVDVLAAGAPGATAAPVVEVVASGARVLTAPTPAVTDGPTAGATADGGLLVLAVSPGTAARLAAAAATATLTVTLGRP